MQLPQIIQLPEVNLTHQRITEFKYLKLELYDTTFVYGVDLKAEQPEIDDDPEGPWKEYRVFIDCKYRRTAVEGIEKAIVILPDRWQITLYLTSSNNIRIYFLKKAECFSVYDQLDKYFFPS